MFFYIVYSYFQNLQEPLLSSSKGFRDPYICTRTGKIKDTCDQTNIQEIAVEDDYECTEEQLLIAKDFNANDYSRDKKIYLKVGSFCQMENNLDYLEA